MNNKIYLKLFLFFLGIEVIVLWISFKNISLVFLWMLNTLIILFMFFDVKIDLKSLNIFFINIINILSQFIGWLVGILENLFKKKNKNTLDNNLIKKFNLNLDYLKTFLEPIKYFYLKWGFVLSIIILILAILDNIILHKFNLSIFWSTIFFLIWLFVLYKNILDGEIYIGRRIITTKDIILILSLFITLVVFTLSNSFALYEKVFYSLVFWLIFYLIAIFSLDYTNVKLKLFNSVFIYIYLWLTFISFFIYLYNQIPVLKHFFTIEKIVYKEKPIYKTKIVYKEKIITKKEIPSKNYIAPNGKVYEIFLTSTWVYFTWYNNTKKYFDSYDQAINIIDKFNQKKDEDINIKNKKNITTHKNISTISNTDVNNTPTITDVISSLLNNDENKISQDVKWEKTNNILIYYDIIPYLVSKYWLSSDNKKYINFKYISKNDWNYKYFKTAYYHKMFGKNSNPKWKVRCRNFAVLLWLAEWWKVNYNRSNVFDVFYQKAIQKWYEFNKCCKSQYDYLTESKKTCILK